MVPDDLTRREFVGVTAAGVTLAGMGAETLEAAPASAATVHCLLIINGQQHDVDIDPRVTLLDSFTCLEQRKAAITASAAPARYFQCGFCTSGQTCSAVAMLEEWKAGMPSA